MGYAVCPLPYTKGGRQIEDEQRASPPLVKGEAVCLQTDEGCAYLQLAF